MGTKTKWEPVDYIALVVIAVSGALLAFGLDGAIKGIFGAVVFRYFAPKVIHNVRESVKRTPRKNESSNKSAGN